MDNEALPGDDREGRSDSVTTAEDKSHTFRKRRLTVTNLRQLDDGTGLKKEEGQCREDEDSEGDDQNDDDPFDFQSSFVVSQPQEGTTKEGDIDHQIKDHTDANFVEKAHSFRKRRLSLTHNRDGNSASEDTNEPPNQRRRRASDASQSSMESMQERLQSRTVHAAELLANPPPSPSVHQLYQQKSAPPQRQTMNVLVSTEHQPKWRKRHIRHLHEDERILPFPRDMVGTYSCHGVEPIYDDDYVIEDDEVSDWGIANDAVSPTDPEKPTTAAKINQDRGGVAFPYGNCSRTALFAVYDGHGQGGELVAQFALHEMQRKLEKHEHFEKDIEKAFRETFLSVDESLKKEDLIEPLYAGTTACVALLRERKLVLANAGDSRAVLARRSAQGNYAAFDLTRDQNPDLPEEQARIERMGGFVSPPPEPGLSARVWLDTDCTQIGLAMARSIGDHAVKEVGVTAEPVITFHDLTLEDEFVIFATDGVWEFISSEAAVKIVAENLERGATKACQCLIEAAAARWHEEEGDYRDDITALVVRLSQLWQYEHPKPFSLVTEGG